MNKVHVFRQWRYKIKYHELSLERSSITDKWRYIKKNVNLHHQSSQNITSKENCKNRKRMGLEKYWTKSIQTQSCITFKRENIILKKISAACKGIKTIDWAGHTAIIIFSIWMWTISIVLWEEFTRRNLKTKP